jgi:glycine/D-amino acid oxidase-like deaminating enzyme
VSPAPARARGGRPDARPDVIVIGAGIVGSCCALALAEHGLSVCVVDRGGPAGGTTGAGEGNILVSDKVPGPELDLARRSVVLWRELAARLDAGIEFEPKGGLVVADSGAQLARLHDLATAQAGAGVAVEPLDAGVLLEREPLLSPALAGGAFYPEDAQVQPMLATAAVLAEARRLGVDVRHYTELGEVRRDSGGAHVLETAGGRLAAPDVVVAAGPWSADVAARFGARLPVVPRRGHVLVTEPLAAGVRHKVYAADYVGTIASAEGVALCSPVVESTASGTILIGSSRELVGFDRRPSPGVMAEIARRAVRLFPFLAGVRAVRCYLGFRPAAPDRLPVIGPDPRVEGLHHATGHEGAGIGLAPATAALLAALVAGAPAPSDPAPFDPRRFEPEAA